MTLIELARAFLYVHEAKDDNTGHRVEAIQRWGGGTKGDPWCAYFATLVLDIHFQGHSPIPRLGSCDDILTVARKNGWIVELPHVGDLYLFVRPPNDAYHVGLVTDVNTHGFLGLSGNTSVDGLSSNGDRVAERWQTIRPNGRTLFVRYPSKPEH